MPLMGHHKEKLRIALTESFQTYSELARFSQEILKFTLALKTGENAGLDNNADALIMVMDQNGHVPKLINALRAQRPDRADVRLLDQELAGTFQAFPDIKTLPSDLPPAVQSKLLKQGVENVIVGSAGFASSEIFVSKLGVAEYRVCYIQFSLPGGANVFGSGFLINDDLVITNEHVIHHACPPGLPFALDGNAIKVRFGFRNKTSEIQEYALAPDWLVARDPKERPDGSRGLDYAILRLSKNAGEQTVGASSTSAKRGHLTPVAVLLQLNEPVLILQHPCELVTKQPSPMQLTIGFITQIVDDEIRYTANTLKGTSGSPVFNAQMDLIGLHYWGDLSFNAGILFTKIRAHLQMSGLENIVFG